MKRIYTHLPKQTKVFLKRNTIKLIEEFLIVYICHIHKDKTVSDESLMHTTIKHFNVECTVIDIRNIMKRLLSLKQFRELIIELDSVESTQYRKIKEPEIDFNVIDKLLDDFKTMSVTVSNEANTGLFSHADFDNDIFEYAKSFIQVPMTDTKKVYTFMSKLPTSITPTLEQIKVWTDVHNMGTRIFEIINALAAHDLEYFIKDDKKIKLLVPGEQWVPYDVIRDKVNESKKSKGIRNAKNKNEVKFVEEGFGL